VILMGRANLGELAAQLISQGRDPSTPAACIQSATTPEQRVTRATLATIAEAADRDGLESPVVTVIGAVAALGGEAGRRVSTQARRHPEQSDGSLGFTPPRRSRADVTLGDPSLRSG
jgi:siroheme synthase